MLKNEPNPRREFLGKLTAGAAAAGLATFPTLAFGEAPTASGENWAKAEEVFKKINGKHKVVFDVTQPHGVFPFAWPRVFLMTNEVTGTPEKENSVVVVLRHDAIAYAMEDRLWPKYNFAEVFHVPDPTNADAKPTKNPFSNMAPMPIPGLGPVKIGIQDLQASGVQFVVCNAALTVYSAAVAGEKDPAVVKKDWEAGLLPGITVVPSGVWAVGRAQEKGCAYIFAS